MSVISRLAEETGKSEGFVQAWADERGIVLDNLNFPHAESLLSL